MSLVVRKLNFTFKLGLGSFGENGEDVVTVSGLRSQVAISNASGPGLGQAQARIYGLPPSLLHQLASLNAAESAIRRNTLVITAGDANSAMATAFEGQITLSQLNLNSAPDSVLTVMATAGALAAVQLAPPTSYPAGADVAVILQNLAHVMGLQFENNGVSTILHTQYLQGSPLEQVARCIHATGIGWTIDEKTNVLAIWPTGGNRGGSVPLISPSSGLVGYPSYSSGTYQWLSLTTVFNPLLRIGGLVKVESSLNIANGTWQVFNLSHALESETPGGQWFTRFDGKPNVQ